MDWTVVLSVVMGLFLFNVLNNAIRFIVGLAITAKTKTPTEIISTSDRGTL